MFDITQYNDEVDKINKIKMIIMFFLALLQNLNGYREIKKLN